MGLSIFGQGLTIWGKPSQTLSWGALLDAAGNLALAGAAYDTADTSHNVPGTTEPVAIDGTINNLVIAHTGDLSTNNGTFKVLVNTSVKATVVATGGAGTSDAFSGLGIAVVVGDLVEIEWDAGSTNPAQTIIKAVVE